ncbi:hypothetical protein MycrhDRAFT_5520 [Mycolicibacterium rhodesiae JS60]|nr:hypothetical protein MycrhDRAFT_5520 [Mycolicibacterium rhodesiae JS60]
MGKYSARPRSLRSTPAFSLMRGLPNRLHHRLIRIPAACRLKWRPALAAALVALATAFAPIASAPPASAGGWVTIFPNYGDWNCGAKGGVVQHVKVAAFPGETQINANNQRWARINVASSGNVRLVAQIYCVYGFFRTPGGWNTVDRTIRNPVPWKSYYF